MTEDDDNSRARVLGTAYDRAIALPIVLRLLQGLLALAVGFAYFSRAPFLNHSAYWRSGAGLASAIVAAYGSWPYLLSLVYCWGMELGGWKSYALFACVLVGGAVPVLVACLGYFPIPLTWSTTLMICLVQAVMFVGLAELLYTMWGMRVA